MSNKYDIREEVKKILIEYLKGRFKDKDFLKKIPEYEDDKLLDDIINTFCEPLQDNPAMKNWEQIVAISIKALEENWTVERYNEVLEKGEKN